MSTLRTCEAAAGRSPAPAAVARLFATALAALFLVEAAPTRATVTATPLAVEGAASPDGNGAFGGFLQFNEPCVNDSGQVAFACHLNGTASGSADDEVLVRTEPNGALNMVAREGSLIPGATGLFGPLNIAPRQYTMNNNGRVAFTAGLTGTPGGPSDNEALFSSDAGVSIAMLARRGDPAPGTTSTFNSILGPPSINNESPAGIAFYASINPSSMPGALYIAGGSTLTHIHCLGVAAPDGNGTLSTFGGSDPPAIRPNDRSVALWIHLTGTAMGVRDDDGIYFVDETTNTQVARGHDTVGGAELEEFTEPVCNVFGNAAFLTNLYPTSDGEAIVIAGDGSDDLVVRKGQALPDTSGFFASFWWPSLSAGNLAAFVADLSGTPGGGFDDSGVYRGDGTILIQVAREDQAVPEGGGRFASFDHIVGINAAAQVLFSATLRGTPGGSADDRGLYLWDEGDGLVKLLREGDMIGGRTVLAFSTLTARDYGGFHSLNDGGVAVARVDLSGIGGDGVYLFQNASGVAVAPGSPADRATLAFGPSPFGAGPVMLRYSLPTAGPIRVTVFDIGGRAVRTLFRGPADRSGTLRWAGTDADDRPLPSGVYFVRLESPWESIVQRIVKAR